MNSLTAISSWSGGKDSCLAHYRAIKQGIKVESLLTFISRESKRGCFHGIDSGLLKFQAELIGMPLAQEETTADMQKYEEEFKTAVGKFIAQGINAMVFGDIYLLEHQSWVERVCGELNINAIEPLWNNRPEDILEEFIDAGFKAIIVSCQADKLDKSFIGREVDMGLIGELKSRGICPCGENGEFHTLVVDGPLFKRRIQILESEPVLKQGFWKYWFLDIKRYQ